MTVRLALVPSAGAAARGYSAALYRVGAILVGAEKVSLWRPYDERLRALVCAIDAVRRDSDVWPIDVGAVAAELHGSDPTWPWCDLISAALSRWDDVHETVDQRGPSEELYLLVLLARDALDKRLDRMLDARADARRAYETLHRACELYESSVGGLTG